MRRHRNRIPTGRGGFSLLELMITLTIMGMVLAAAVPSFLQRNSRYRTEDGARELASRCQLAREMALNSRRTFRVVFEPRQRQYTFQRQDSASVWTPDPAQTYEVTGVDTMSTSIGPHDTGGETVVFEGGGTIAATSAPAIIRFIHQGDTSTVNVVRTGRVTVTGARE